MKLSEFDYNLPKELIAQYPLRERDHARLMVLDCQARSIEHRFFSDITKYVKPGDSIILNDTKVIPSRLFGKRRSGGKVEIFLLGKTCPVCEALVRPSNRLREGERVTIESGDEVEILGRGAIGRNVRFNRSLDAILEEAGHMPLPPYIGRMDEPSDKSLYQTVYAEKEGATASPTAGLHFTGKLLDRVRGQGARVGFVTLHTNYGTFAPIKSDEVEKHKMHKEYFDMPRETADLVNGTKKAGGNIFAVGTTSARVLEYCAKEIMESNANGQRSAVSGYTDLFIYPGYQFKIVDHLITNFHLPKSTLLLLVSAFAGKEFIFDAYRKAIEERYRFYSYGDVMLIL